MKSLILFRKVCNMVYCCGLDIPQWKAREKIKQLCEAGNNDIGGDREDKFVVCELDIDWQKYSIEELAHLCEDYCKRMDSGTEGSNEKD